MMIELVFIVCLAGAPEDCERRSLLYTDISQKVCVRRALPELANWIISHPQWKIARWTCEVVRPGEHDI
ncbi:hypothetical protein AB9K34_08565 [Sedimentitalea sp. XS_ASV28]|uniref:hypothetical protein n=1 Tax=Sedimentitalea sp. XS_ASV28 TaxID=3241296 RepID=UPI0035117AAF